MKLVIKGAPIAKARPRFVNGHTYTPLKTVNAEKTIAWAFKAAQGKLTDNPVKISITAYFDPPKGTSKRETERLMSGAVYRDKKPDVDNLAKAVLDGLNGAAYKDDKQVVELSVCKKYGCARTEVEIEEVTDGMV